VNWLATSLSGMVNAHFFLVAVCILAVRQSCGKSEDGVHSSFTLSFGKIVGDLPRNAALMGIWKKSVRNSFRSYTPRYGS
jgi:hypothetical protein